MAERLKDSIVPKGYRVQLRTTGWNFPPKTYASPRTGAGKSLPKISSGTWPQAGLTVKFASFEDSLLAPWRLPLLVQFLDGQIGVIETVASDGSVGINFSGDQGLQSSSDFKTIVDEIARVAILRPARSVEEARVDDYIKPDNKHWFRKIILRDLKPYGHVTIATTVANMLGLAGILFARQVYDRVIPADSMSTLYVLVSGVLLAVVFGFIMRMMRVRLTDLLGKRADICVSDMVFGHAVRLRNSARPKCTGTFIFQIRELERVRELVTSTTVLALADMAFFMLFLLVMWVLAGRALSRHPAGKSHPRCAPRYRRGNSLGASAEWCFGVCAEDAQGAGSYGIGRWSGPFRWAATVSAAVAPLIRQPNIIFLDEPTAALDEATDRRFIQNLNE